MKDFIKILGKSVLLFLIMMILCGLLYTLAMTGISALFFQDKANGSIIEVNGVKYGSGLLGQQFTDPGHLWGRIMILDVSTYQDEEGNPLMYAGASNKSPAGEEFEKLTAERVAMIREANPDADMDAIPVELVTCSGSGLDPHISPAAAEYQVPRIAQARDIPEEKVREVIAKYTNGRFLGILGEKTVNVLEVNLALDGILTE